MTLLKKLKTSKTKVTKRKRGKTSREQPTDNEKKRPERRQPEAQEESTAAMSARGKKDKHDKTKRGKKPTKPTAQTPGNLSSRASTRNGRTDRERPASNSPSPNEMPNQMTSRETLSTKNITVTSSNTTLGTTTVSAAVSVAQPTTMTTFAATGAPGALGALGAPGAPGMKQEWLGESIAGVWMDKANFPKAKGEFDQLVEMPVNLELCKKYTMNPKLNQPPETEFPCLDSNLVKAEPNYVNMSHVEVPLHRNVVIGQLPTPGAEEHFWKAMFDVRAGSIHVLIGDGETADFFPQKSGEFSHFGSMFVNNRKVTVVTDDVVRFAVEVLPDGCSNSIITNLTLIKNWNIDSVHAKYSAVIKETIELTNFLSASQPDETALIISKHGAGRAGYFLALSIAVTKMDQRLEPDLFEICRAIRAQRPRAVDTLTQYASLYISMFYYIKRKSSKTLDGDKKAVADPNDPMCRKAMQLTAAFTSGLMAEAANGQSMMTTPLP